MTPLIAAGAASVAGELVSRLASAVTSVGKSAISSSAPQGRGFDQALSHAAGKNLQQRQLEELRERLWQIPEVAQALSAQPVGAVTAAEVRADGTLAIATTRGSLEIAVSAESRMLVQQAYQGMAALGAPRADLSGVGLASSSGTGLRVPGILVPARSL